MPPIDPLSWEVNAKELIALIEQQQENVRRIAALERADLVRSTAGHIRRTAGSAGWSVLGLALPYLLKYVFHVNPLP